MKSNIYLIGFMGTGKSTVSRSLSELLGYEELDTDAWIAGRQKQSITEIFEKEGEEAFRDMETALLQQLAGERHKIISCGGGIALRGQNARLMQANGAVVLLTAQPETVLDRVAGDEGRPVLNGNMNAAYIRNLMEQREPYYQAAKDMTIATDHRSPAEIAEEIKKNLQLGKISFDF